MAITVTITLTTAGTDTGPFNLYSNVDGYVSAFETSVTKVALVAGYTSTLVPDSTTTIRVKSTGVCTNYVDLPVVVPTTTTTTSSTTTSPVTSLFISARDAGSLLSVQLYYSINAGAPILLDTIDGHFCYDFGSIPGLAVGNVITFTTSTSCVMVGTPGYNVCPLISGSATTYTYTIGSTGTSYVSISINSDINP